MTANQRIALNFIATYGRSLYALVVGLLCGRWTLQALGEVDYGLMGLVGGLMVFVAFLNSLMASAVGRFYAVAVGESSVNGGEGIEICRKWFNTALLIHTVVPVVLLAVGYPMGVWAIENFLTIPPERVSDCIWVWRLTCASSFLSMVTVPYTAYYYAKQYIAELTIYSFCTITLNGVFLYYMVTHPGVWLVRLSFWSCLLGILPQIIIALRALVMFQECRFCRQYLWDRTRIVELFAYAGCRFLGAFSVMLKTQGLSVLVNKMLGPARNAAMSIGVTVSGNANQLAVSLMGALSPAISNSFGAGDIARMRRLSYAACKLSAVLVAVFALPLLLVVDDVLVFWLTNPPDWAGVLCFCRLIGLIFENVTCGQYMALFACGKIGKYQTVEATVGLFSVPFAALLMWFKFDLLAVGCSIILFALLNLVVRSYFSQRFAFLSTFVWLKSILIPLICACLVAVGPGLLVRNFISFGIMRILTVSVCVNLVFVPLVWCFVMNAEERLMVSGYVGKFFGRFARKTRTQA